MLFPMGTRVDVNGRVGFIAGQYLDTPLVAWDDEKGLLMPHIDRVEPLFIRVIASIEATEVNERQEDENSIG